MNVICMARRKAERDAGKRRGVTTFQLGSGTALTSSQSDSSIFTMLTE
jgi:hypothetical protein